MLIKASYILLSAASLGLLLFEAPRAELLTRAPDTGKVERQDNPTAPSQTATTRYHRHHYVFIGGYHRGK